MRQSSCFALGQEDYSRLFLWLDGEFEKSPGVALIGIVLGAVLMVTGMIGFREGKMRGGAE